jgi:uncharacterized Zn ribbon protein
MKISALLAVIMLLFIEPASYFISGFYPLETAMAEELSAQTYYGNTMSSAVLSNINYTDVAGKNIWSKDAIYWTGALSIVKGLDAGTKKFNRNLPLTKEEALAIVLRAVGREEEAQQTGIEINNGREAADKKTDPQAVLYDGYLQIACDDGLISDQDLEDALTINQSTLTASSFKRKGYAQRQEIAYWLAKALDIEPASQQSELLNYTDWRSTDPEKLLYLEAILQKKIMNGNGSLINPKQSVTRDQAAQIVKNAENMVLAALKYTKNSGTITNIMKTNDYTGDVSNSGRKIEVDNYNGTTSYIITSQAASAAGNRNENSGASSAAAKAELVVYKNGALGNSSLLSKGDRIQYITDKTNTVKYVIVISNVNDTRYEAVQVNNVDSANMLIDVTGLFNMNYPDIDSILGNISFKSTKDEKSVYRIAPNAVIKVNGSISDLSGVTSDATAILTIDQNNRIKEIQCIDLGINTEARRIVRGIVEENNPSLGYITIYNEDGSGTGNSALLRTYNYGDQNNTEIFRNHETIDADSIQAGDTVYLKLDNDGSIVSVSAVDNYSTAYGRIISKKASGIVVKYKDGSEQVLEIGDDVIIIKDKKLVGINSLKDGDNVRLLINDTENGTEIKEVTIEGDEHYISNIYKGTVQKLDPMSKKITVMGMQVFNNGKWDWVEQKGSTQIPLADSYSIYADNVQIDINKANKLMYENEAYIAVEKSYGGEEKAVVLSYRKSDDTLDTITSGTITGAVSGSGTFTILSRNQKVSYSAGSIIVKYGRLVSGSSLSNDDQAYFAIDRDYSGGNYKASVVQVNEPVVQNALSIYRGRIKAIDDGRSFMVESFSQLIGTGWYYSNTPKSFNITSGTRALDESGVLNMDNFIGYGADSYIGRTVYVAADGTNAVLISTAPYGTVNMKGTVYKMEDTKLYLRDVVEYNMSTYLWEIKANDTINVLKNSIIIKNGKITDVSAIKKGDSVRILKKDNDTDADGYIIFIE